MNEDADRARWVGLCYWYCSALPKHVFLTLHDLSWFRTQTWNWCGIQVHSVASSILPLCCKAGRRVWNYCEGLTVKSWHLQQQHSACGRFSTKGQDHALLQFLPPEFLTWSPCQGSIRNYVCLLLCNGLKVGPLGGIDSVGVPSNPIMFFGTFCEVIVQDTCCVQISEAPLS